MSKQSSTTVQALDELGTFEALRQEYWRDWLDKKTGYIRFEEWSSLKDWTEVFATLTGGMLTRSGSSCYWYGKVKGIDAFVQKYASTSWGVTLHGDDQNAVDGVLHYLQELIPTIVNSDENFIDMAFWSMDGMGNPTSWIRRIESHKWNEIQSNYPQAVSKQLDDLMKINQPESGGKLILWHGEAGLGKTHCIRALAHAWRSWANVDYVVDPEALFGRAHYMMNCLVNGRNESDKWRLIVLEDAGNFLRKDAKDREGQSFGRLLNLTDGLVGHGLKLITLITTNEPFGELHPAVARPGRCLSRLEFSLFEPDEASEWLGHHVSEQKTLADLYEMKSEGKQIKREAEHYRPGVYV